MAMSDSVRRSFFTSGWRKSGGSTNRTTAPQNGADCQIKSRLVHIMDGNQYNLSGGSGTISPSSFNIHSLTGTYDHYVPTSQDGWARDQVTGTMSGSVTAGASTLNATGNYSVKDATGATLDSGTVSGSSLAH